MKKLLPFFIMSYNIVFSQSIEASKYPIDIQFMECVGGSMSPRAVVGGCATVAIEEWDGHLNKYYKLLMKKIKSLKNKKELKEAQVAWLNYRDKEFKNLTNMVYGEGNSGSMYSALTSIYMLEFVRDRALSIENYYKHYEIEE